MKSLCSPATETGSHLRLHTITQSDNHIKVVMVNVAFHLTITFLTN